MAISLRNPDTNEVHELDDAALKELAQAYEQAKKLGQNEVVFRAMRLTIEVTETILGEGGTR